MEGYKNLLDRLRKRAEGARELRYVKLPPYETLSTDLDFAADTIENLLNANKALHQIAEKQATMNVKLTNKVLVMDKELHEAKSELNAMRNELCFKCGNYKQANNGACDGCRWKET